ncbi:MAG: cytochrome c [Proteobacteria bacterium]|nr:cytochrome c [Pseudomonadota bacterium]
MTLASGAVACGGSTVAAGERVFRDYHCGDCHSLKAGEDGVGPSLAGVGDRAARASGGAQSARAWLREAVVDPNQTLAGGAHRAHRGGASRMPDSFEAALTPAELQALLDFLQTLP